MPIWSLFSVALLAAATPPPEEAPQASGEAGDLTELSLEELSNVEVTSVSRVKEPLGGAASAITVITQDDLRRSGVTSVPEALRLAPGLHVARVSASSWAVSSRGFSSVQSNKLLVLSDTRSVYTPLFSGVFWDAQDWLLQDVERIEVIRGPGATLWGANAVNGVINVTTRNSRDTQGLYLEGGGGTEEQGFGAVRYGGKASENLHYRVTAKFFNRDGGYTPTGAGTDAWWRGQVSMRTDWDVSAKDHVMFQGGLYRGDVHQIRPAVTIIGRAGPSGPWVAKLAGGHVLGRWTRQFSESSHLQIRAYYDRTRRDDPTFLDDLHTFDLDLQHRFALPFNQDVLWGLTYRATSNQNVGKALFNLNPADATDHLVALVLQDRITLFEVLRVTLGTKLERNTFSGFEVQPSARVAWDFWSGHTAWGAVSRAVRVPTRLERDISIPLTDAPASPLPRLEGTSDFKSEVMVAYELGYRWQPTQALFVDLAAFYNTYQGLSSLELGNPKDEGGGQIILPIVNTNQTRGVSKGFEAAVSFRPLRRWELSGRYSNLVLTLAPSGMDLNRGELLEGASPRHQVGVNSFLQLPAGLELDLLFRWVSELRSSPDAPVGVVDLVPAYATMDAQLSWRPWNPLRVSVVGQNLLQRQHREFWGGTWVERGVYAKVAITY